MSNKSKRYTIEFKKQIAELTNNGKNPMEIVKEYNIARFTVNKWVKDYNNSGSFKSKDNRTGEENELLNYVKKIKDLKWKMIF